jgi:hypothetical protein
LQNANASGTTHSEVDGNTFEGGGYLRLNQSSHVVVDANSFTIEDGAGQGIRISNNNFGPNSAPSDIAVTNNSFTAGATAPASAAAIAVQAGDQSLPVTYPVASYTGNTLTGLSLETKVTGGAANEDLTHYGTNGANLIDGGAGNDSLAGGAGNDILTGGLGTDTAVYAGSLTATNIRAVIDADPTTAGNQAGWQVSAGAEGTDLLNGVESVTDGAGHHFLLVGNGGYATIQAAINAASAGDTIEVAAGTYNEHVDVNKDVTIDGANFGVTWRARRRKRDHRRHEDFCRRRNRRRRRDQRQLLDAQHPGYHLASQHRPADRSCPCDGRKFGVQRRRARFTSIRHHRRCCRSQL